MRLINSPRLFAHK